MKKMQRLLLTALVCLAQTSLWAVTEINVETAGTLQSLLTETEQELKVTGVINGTDIKFIRSLVQAGTVTKLDWSGVSIVSGGEAYTESFTTQDNIIGEKMFYECSKLQRMVLPTNVTAIQTNAFSRTGLKKIDIPGSVMKLGGDAFAYCSSLDTVVIGKKFSVHIEAAAVVGGDGEAVFLFLTYLQRGLEQDAEVVLGVVKVHQVQVPLGSLHGRFSQRGKVRKVSFRPVVPDFVTDLGFGGAGGQGKEGTQRQGNLFVHKTMVG